MAKQALLPATGLGYADAMASEHMIEAIGNLEWAVARLEEAAAALPAPSPDPAPTPAPVGALTEASQPELDREAARAALRSLDALIGELKGRGETERANG